MKYEELTNEVARLKKLAKTIDVAFGTVCGILLFVAVVVCPIMVKM